MINSRLTATFLLPASLNGMLIERLGLSVWITDSKGNRLPEYQVKQNDENETIQCWIPSTEGTTFRIRWKVLGNPQPKLDLCAYPVLDGVKMTGSVLSKKSISEGNVGALYNQPTGPKTARLYEFGKRELTDSDAGVKLDTPAAGMLNTIQVDLVWGKSSGRSKVRKNFSSVQEIGPIYEKTAKKGLSDAAKLGDTINTSKSKSRPFNPDPILNKVVFIFNYAPEGWLRAQGILSSDPTHNQDTQGTLKREHNTSPEVVDLDEIDTDDDEIQIIKHMIPAPSNKRQRTEKEPASSWLKKEEN